MTRAAAMAARSSTRDVSSARLDKRNYVENFSDHPPPLTLHQAIVASDRCYFCFDAPCMQACPTHIDIPKFIYQIRSANLEGSAKTILEENIFGATCARACPVENLCEGACVRNVAEGQPVRIGLLQRVATDHVMDHHIQLFRRADPTGRTVAVVGGGPAGLACAHRLAMYGHRVTVYEAREKLGGLNEYGIATYKMTDNIAQREVEYLLKVGGIELRTGVHVGRDVTLGSLQHDYDAVFLGIGLTGENRLGVPEEEISGVYNALEYIEALRQTDDLATLPVGRRIVVIGGGMTAIDISAQIRLLGADEVTMLYRRGQAEMGASWLERELAQTRGVNIRFWSQPRRLLLSDHEITGVEVERTRLVAGKLVGTRSCTALAADMVFKAIGQKLVISKLGSATEAEILDTADGRVSVDDDRRTSLERVWAGGDCTDLGENLTVVATEDGKVAAESIHRTLSA